MASFLILAQKGNVLCQYNLGVLYGQLGTSKDDAQALFWYEKAAAQGYADAQANLALMYIQGNGVPKDYSIAAEYLSKAAEQGHAGAQHNLKMIVKKIQGQGNLH
jgi:TPR repeat protein